MSFRRCFVGSDFDELEVDVQPVAMPVFTNDDTITVIKINTVSRFSVMVKYDCFLLFLPNSVVVTVISFGVISGKNFRILFNPDDFSFLLCAQQPG